MLTCDLMLMQDEACRSPEALSMALAAQAYAKSELMWYFRHVAESLPPAPTASTSAGGVNKLVLPLLSSPASGPCISEDGHVVTLISAVTTMYDFLVSVKLSVSNQGGGEIPIDVIEEMPAFAAERETQQLKSTALHVCMKTPRTAC